LWLQIEAVGLELVNEGLACHDERSIQSINSTGSSAKTTAAETKSDQIKKSSSDIAAPQEKWAAAQRGQTPLAAQVVSEGT